MISTGVIWICFFVFNFLFDIRERPENAITTSESGRVCKYATPESEQMKAKGYRMSISPAKKPMDVRPWLCGRTFKGCLHVRREGLRTYVQRVPGRTSKEPLNRAERNWTISLMKYCTKGAFLCSVWVASFSRLCEMDAIFRMSKCHSASGSGEPVPLTLMLKSVLNCLRP